jgi:hypothetical protein
MRAHRSALTTSTCDDGVNLLDAEKSKMRVMQEMHVGVMQQERFGQCSRGDAYDSSIAVESFKLMLPIIT